MRTYLSTLLAWLPHRRYEETGAIEHRADFRSGLSTGGHLLYGLARAMKPQVCVEIGSARGLSACFVGRALKDNGSGRLYAIDPHETTEWNDHNSIDSYDLMKEHLERFGVSDVVQVIREYSASAASRWTLPIDMLFIDGDHSYDGVKRDWDLFSRYMKRFGVIVFHDTTWSLHTESEWYRADIGVPRFVEELRTNGYPVVTIDHYCGISLVQNCRGGVPLLTDSR